MEKKQNLKPVFASAVILMIVLYMGIAKEERWNGYLYPDKSDLTTWISETGFESLDQCRSWVSNEASSRRIPRPEYDYECGLNCRYDAGYGMSVCDETLK